MKCLKTVLKWFVYINIKFPPWIDRNGKLLKFLCIVITAVYFKDRNWISKAVYCIICSVVCEIVFCSEPPDILDNAGRVTRRKRTQEISNRYAFHANAKKVIIKWARCINLSVFILLRRRWLCHFNLNNH